MAPLQSTLYDEVAGAGFLQKRSEVQIGYLVALPAAFTGSDFKVLCQLKGLQCMHNGVKRVRIHFPSLPSKVLPPWDLRPQSSTSQAKQCKSDFAFLCRPGTRLPRSQRAPLGTWTPRILNYLHILTSISVQQRVLNDKIMSGRQDEPPAR